MASKKKTPSLVESGEIAGIGDSKLAKLMQRCGIEVMPACHTMLVPIESITVPDLDLARPSTKLLKSIEAYGIRQPPSVAFLSGSACDAPDAKYVVVMGSRRVVSARTLFFKKQDPRFKVIKCEVYEQNVPGLNDVLALMENSLRSDAWVRDIIRLRRLIEQKIAMTLDDLAEYGFQRSSIKKKLDIALLPATLLDPICAGEVSWNMAMQIIRLKEGPRNQLVTLVQSGKALTSELVKEVYRGQIDQGMNSVQVAMLHWQPATVTQVTGNGHIGSPVIGSLAQNGEAWLATGGTPSPAEVLAMLQRFEACILSERTLSQLTTLNQVYMSELQAVLRSARIEAKATQEVSHG
jgi:ParB-like chromosome segregation protein Spo0J